MRPLRSLFASAAALAVLGMSAACSGGADDGASAAAAASGTAAATHSVPTAEGAVTVPSTPQRIVAIQPSAFATLLDVGDAAEVVGVYDEGADYVSPRYLTAYNAATKVGSEGELDLEKIAALKPDLIIGVDYSWNTDDYKQLSAIAPTVIAPVTSWQDTAKTVAEAAGRGTELDALSAKLGTREAQIKTAYATTLARYRWDILQGGFDSGQYWIYGPGSDVGTILGAAGVRFATAGTRTPGADDRSVSYEQIDLLDDADVIGYYADYSSTAPANDGPQLWAQAGFKALTATKTDRLVPLPDFLPGGYGDALAVLDELTAGLKALAAGS
jgi:iron complex transport system substrate-binding protein